MLKVTSGMESAKSFVTRSDTGLKIMLINTSETEEATVAVQTKEPADLKGNCIPTRGEYFWDVHARKPL